MTNAELQALRTEYRAEHAAVTAWLAGQPYTGAWLTELVGKAAPTNPAKLAAIKGILPPGLLFKLFEQRVFQAGGHGQYADVETAPGVLYSSVIGDQIADMRGQLAAALEV